MKAYKVEILVIDHDELGADGIEQELENTKFANHCMHPKVMDVEEADLGEWEDSHPLNQRDGQREEYERLFPKYSMTINGPQGQRFEHKTVNLTEWDGKTPEFIIQQMEKEGWELCSVFPHPLGASVYFKRPIG